MVVVRNWLFVQVLTKSGLRRSVIFAGLLQAFALSAGQAPLTGSFQTFLVGSSANCWQHSLFFTLRPSRHCALPPPWPWHALENWQKGRFNAGQLPPCGTMVHSSVTDGAPGLRTLQHRSSDALPLLRHCVLAATVQGHWDVLIMSLTVHHFWAAGDVALQALMTGAGVEDADDVCTGAPPMGHLPSMYHLRSRVPSPTLQQVW